MSETTDPGLATTGDGAADTSVSPPAPADTSGSPDATTPSSGTPTDATTGAPSAPAESDGPSSLLDAVKDAIKPKEPAEKPATEAPAADATTDPNAKPETTAADADAERDFTDAELQQVKPHTRKYIGRLIRQRQQARDDLAAVEPELAQHRQLRSYLDTHKLAAEDVNLLLGVGAALRRGDYKAFLDGIEPYRNVARQSLGLDVAPDLRSRVDDGSMSEDAARELTRTRLDAARARAEAETQTGAVTQRDLVALQTTLRTAVDGWEAGVKARDPDYALKEVQIRRTSQALLAEQGAPRTAADAVALAQRAYDEVSQAFSRARPAPQATRPQPAGVSTPSLGASREPRSLLEAVRLAAQASRVA